MKVTSVDLYSPNFAEAITFSLRESDPNAQYMVRTILGIDAEEIIPKFYGSGLNSGRFYDFGLNKRDIVIRVVLNPRYHLDESVSDIRDELYRAISATRTGQVTLFFNAGTTIVAKISGFISKFEVPYFAELPEVQITISCDDPMFRGVNPVIFEPADLSDANPVIIPDSLSTAPHGFKLQVTYNAASQANFIIQDDPTDPNWKFTIIPENGFQSGDVVHISSDYSNKQAYMVRGSTTTYLIDRIEPSSVWPIIFPGANVFHFLSIEYFDWNTLEYYAAYWGV